MSFIMNEFDIDEAVHHLCSTNAGEVALVLQDFKDVVNENSDGWAYWRAANAAAVRLQRIVSQYMDAWRRGNDYIEPLDTKQAYANIRRFCTKHGLPRVC